MNPTITGRGARGPRLGRKRLDTFANNSYIRGVKINEPGGPSRELGLLLFQPKINFPESPSAAKPGEVCSHL